MRRKVFLMSQVLGQLQEQAQLWVSLKSRRNCPLQLLRLLLAMK